AHRRNGGNHACPALASQTGGTSMRMLAAAAVIAACIASAALAQEEAPTLQRFEPQWASRPSARDFARYTPSSLVERGAPGVAHLCCTARDDGRLDCRSGFEWPEGGGYGAASVRIAHGFRLTPESLAAYRADANAWIQIP